MSTSVIFESRYKNRNAVTIRNHALQFQFIPESGGKLASAVDLQTGREFMLQRDGDIYLTQPYDGVYVQGECSGFDDMFPTIDQCTYERFPWKGTPIPDHGEVWSLPWDAAVQGDSIYMKVNGVRLPYVLEKKAAFTEETTLRVDYRLTNPTPFALDFIWAAHVMIPAEEGAQIVLPDSRDQAVCIFSKSGRLGRYGSEFRWQRQRIDRIRPKNVGDFEKYYFREPEEGENWCAIRYPGGNELRLSLPGATVPYLGVLSNEGGWEGLYHVILEPCTATMDRLEAASLYQTLSRVDPYSTIDWHLDLTIT